MHCQSQNYYKFISVTKMFHLSEIFMIQGSINITESIQNLHRKFLRNSNVNCIILRPSNCSWVAPTKDGKADNFHLKINE